MQLSQTIVVASAGVFLLGCIVLLVSAEAGAPETPAIVLSAEREGDNIWLMDTDAMNPRPVIRVDANPLPLGLVWSPDGNQIAFHTEAKGNIDIFLVNPDGQGLRRLTEHEGEDSWPTWHPGGQRIAFATDRDGNFEIYEMILAGKGLRNITNDPAKDIQPDWSRDGRKIAFSSKRGRTISDIHVMNPNGGNLVNLTNHKGGDFEPTWSPDGSKIVWSSTRHGNGDLFLMDSNGENMEQLTGPGKPNGRWFEEREITWAPSGEEFAFITFHGGTSNLTITDKGGENIVEMAPINGVHRAPSWFDPEFVEVFSVSPINERALSWGWLKQVGRSD